MKPIIRVFLALLVLAGLLFVTTTSKHMERPVHAQTGCSVGTLNGAYAFTQAGYTSKNMQGALFPLADVGLANFNGTGTFTTTFTDVSPGVPIGYRAPVEGATGSGTYTVNSNCTGSISITSIGITLDMVIVGGGAEILGINTTPFVVGTLDFKKQ